MQKTGQSGKRVRRGQGRGAEIALVYDMECPACDAYCRFVRIEERELKLIDARAPGALMTEITAASLDIDQGMVVKHDGVLHYGADAIHALALMAPKKGLFSRINHIIFRSRTRARAFYPALRLCRNLLLKVLRKTKINNLGKAGNDRF